MTRRCFLHVGSPKTGTTYLQSVLWGSRDALHEQGFRLPLRNLNDHFFLTLALRGRTDPEVDPPAAVDVLERFQADLAEGGPGHLIVSHELLAAVERERAAEFLQLLTDYEVHVVVTARDLARQVPAEWQQHVKTRSLLTYADFVARVVDRTQRHFWSVQDVASVADRWGRSLPPERVHIVTVPPPGARSDALLTRFCTAVGLAPEGLARDQGRRNQSLGFEQTELLRRVNVALGDRLARPRKGYNGTVRFWFAERVLADQPIGWRLGLPSDRAAWCEQVSREMVERIGRAGYDVVGDLLDLMPGKSSGSGQQGEPSDAELVGVAVEAIASMLDDRDQRARTAPPRPPAWPGGRGVRSRLRSLASSARRRHGSRSPEGDRR